MASLTSWLWGTSQLDDAIEKATSELIPTGSEDVALNLEICDQIRSKSVPAKDAMRALKRRLDHKNPNVQLLALSLTDTCVKNGGDHFLVEVASREFIDNLVSILKVPGTNHLVKADILKCIQNWALAFEGKPSLSYVGQVYKTLKNEGFQFPPKDLALANAAMVDTNTAPEWIDSDRCLRCRAHFTFTNRKHHCRNCGQVFDQQCSAKALPLPHFGITQAVRVCDGCHAKLSKKSERIHRHSTSMYRSRSARDLADAELQRAIQLSLEEVGVNRYQRPGYVPYQPSWEGPSEPPSVDRSTRPNGTAGKDDVDDPDLRAAIEASLREENMPKPSAPVEVQAVEDSSLPYADAGLSQSHPPTVSPTPSVLKLPNYDLEPLEADAILTFSQTVEQVQAQGGKDMSRYPAVNDLYDKANALRPKLAMSLDDTGRKEQLLSEMHDKLSQAVKLYDKVLTEQISQPWRLATAIPQAQTFSRDGRPNTQWTPTPGSMMTYTPQGQQAPTATHAPPPFHPQFAAIPSQPHHLPVQAGISGPSHSFQPPVSSPSVQPSPMQGPPATQPLPILTSQFLPPSQALAPPPPPPTAAPAAMLPDIKTDPLPQRQSSQSPQVSHHALAPQPPLPPSSPALVRRNTTTALRGAGPVSGSISRSPTVAHTRTQSHVQPPRYHSQTQSQLQTVFPSQPPHQVQSPLQTHSPALPQFPVAPTNNPQTFDMYGPSVPTSLPGQERREDLLIDL
ncbi:hypothetical protein PISMIDRAFT_102997 [Pisolithus microcarpus 441]|uniref:Vacuolar protein sorting-associated protein 27 n=1 Tax=Pisolithus microcarpus 441 TaxID=765257 RepID=A0A0C9YBL0_9AGAM|nr:hypothetical protein PISMIDRAFT_102997 [Pisolithus microcarpus 441]